MDMHDEKLRWEATPNKAWLYAVQVEWGSLTYMSCFFTDDTEK